jgi:Ribonuclease G/E
MKYDPSLIKVEEIEINGKKIPIQKIPAGMHGPNGGIISDYEDSYSEEDYEEFTAEDPSVFKEYSEYLDDGADPDSDEVRAYKDDLELKEVKSAKLLDSLDYEEEFDDEILVDIEIEYE